MLDSLSLGLAHFERAIRQDCGTQYQVQSSRVSFENPTVHTAICLSLSSLGLQAVDPLYTVGGDALPQQRGASWTYGNRSEFVHAWQNGGNYRQIRSRHSSVTRTVLSFQFLSINPSANEISALISQAIWSTRCEMVFDVLIFHYQAVLDQIHHQNVERILDPHRFMTRIVYKDLQDPAL